MKSSKRLISLLLSIVMVLSVMGGFTTRFAYAQNGDIELPEVSGEGSGQGENPNQGQGEDPNQGQGEDPNQGQGGDGVVWATYAEGDDDDFRFVKPGESITLDVLEYAQQYGIDSENDTFQWYKTDMSGEAPAELLEGQTGPAITISQLGTFTGYNCVVKDSEGTPRVQGGIAYSVCVDSGIMDYGLTVTGGSASQEAGLVGPKALGVKIWNITREKGQALTVSVSFKNAEASDFTYKWIYADPDDDVNWEVPLGTGSSATIPADVSTVFAECDISDEYGNYLYLNLMIAETEPQQGGDPNQGQGEGGDPNQGQGEGGDPNQGQGEEPPVSYSAKAKYTKNGEASAESAIIYQNIYAAVGDEITLEVVPSHEGFTYAWSQRIWGGSFPDSDPIDGWAYYKPIEGATAATLDTGAQADLYSRQYACEVTYPNGGTRTFQFVINTDPQLAAAATVNGEAAVSNGGAPAMRMISYRVETDGTTPIELGVAATSGLEAELKYAWEWYNEGGNDYERHALGNAAAQTAAEPKAGYVYECKVTDAYHNDVTAAFMMVAPAPQDPGDSFYAYVAGTQETNAIYTVNYGEGKTLSVDAGADTGTISYEWYAEVRVEDDSEDGWHVEYQKIEGQTSKDLALNALRQTWYGYCKVIHSYGVFKQVGFSCSVKTSLAVGNPAQTIYVPAGADLTLKTIPLEGEVPVTGFAWSGYASDWTNLNFDSKTDTLVLTDIQDNYLIYGDVYDECDNSQTAVFSVRVYGNNGQAPGAAAVALNSIRFFGAEDSNSAVPVLTLTPDQTPALTAAKAAELSGFAEESISIKGVSYISAEEGTELPLEITFSNRGLKTGQKWLLFSYADGVWSYIGAVDQAEATTALAFAKLGPTALALQDKALEPEVPVLQWTAPAFTWTWDSAENTYKVAAVHTLLEDSTISENETVTASKTQTGSAVTYKAVFENEAFGVQYMTKDMSSNITAEAGTETGGDVALTVEDKPVPQEQKLTLTKAAKLITRIVKAVAENDQTVLGETADTVDGNSLTDDSSKNLEVVWERNITAPKGTKFPLVIDFDVPGVRDDQEVFVYHFRDGEWELVGSGRGKKVSGTFNGLSPVAIVAAGSENAGGSEEETFSIDPDVSNRVRKAVNADYGAQAELSVFCTISDSTKISAQWYTMTKAQYDNVFTTGENQYVPVLNVVEGTAISGASSLSYTTGAITETEYYFCKVTYSGEPDSPKYAVFSAVPRTGLLEYAWGTVSHEEYLSVKPGASVTVGQAFTPEHGSVTYQWRSWPDAGAIQTYGWYAGAAWYEPDYTVIEGQTGPEYTLEDFAQACILEELVTDDSGRTLSLFYFISLDNGLTATAAGEGLVFTGIDEEMSGYQVRRDVYEATVQSGSSLTITVTGKADTGSVSYNWLSHDNSTEPSLTISNITGSTYAYCRVLDEKDNAIDIDIEIYVASAGFSIADETYNSVYVAPGGNVTLEAVPENATGNVTYTWKKGSVTVGTSRTLSLSGVAENVSYTCTAKDSSGAKATAYYYVILDSGLYVSALTGTKTADPADSTYEARYELHVPMGTRADLAAEFGASSGTIKGCSWTERDKVKVAGSARTTVISESNSAQTGRIWTATGFEFSVTDQYDRIKIILVTVIPDGQFSKGDVDGNGKVDAADLIVLARHVAKIELITDEELLGLADVNNDRKVDADDLTLLSRYVAKIITSLE